MKFDLDEASALLARTPAVLDVWLRGLPDGWLNANEGVDTWSPFDVVGHLINGERTNWMPRVRAILDSGGPAPFPPFDRFAHVRDSAGKSLPELLDEFAALRRESLRALALLRIDAGALDRVGVHPVLGAVTLRNVLATWVAHDLDHMTQIARVMAVQYAEDVGPFRVNLRVISGSPSAR